MVMQNETALNLKTALSTLYSQVAPHVRDTGHNAADREKSIALAQARKLIDLDFIVTSTETAEAETQVYVNDLTKAVKGFLNDVVPHISESVKKQEDHPMHATIFNAKTLIASPIKSRLFSFK